MVGEDYHIRAKPSLSRRQREGKWEKRPSDTGQGVACHVSLWSKEAKSIMLAGLDPRKTYNLKSATNNL